MLKYFFSTLTQCTTKTYPLQILLNDIQAHQTSVDSINDAGKDVISSEAGAGATSTRNKLDRLNANWEKLLNKTKVRTHAAGSELWCKNQGTNL